MRTNILLAANAPLLLVLDLHSHLPIETKFVVPVSSGTSIAGLTVQERYRFSPSIGDTPVMLFKPSANSHVTALRYFHELIEHGLHSY